MAAADSPVSNVNDSQPAQLADEGKASLFFVLQAEGLSIFRF